jgi:ATP-dependent Clp protease, protease subunit
MCNKFEKEEQEESTHLKTPIQNSSKDLELRSIAIIGDITEELSKDVLAGLWFLKKTASAFELANPDDPESREIVESNQPIEIIISTNGGNADDMFAIYDTIRMCRKEMDVETIGLGKVMSAGTLLLACGTKGKRTIGKHCRVMIHSVIGTSSGPLHQIDNEMKEVKAIQDAYIEALAEETNLSVRELRSWLKKKINVYLNADDAVKYGFADIIV